MNSKPKLAALASAAILFGTSATALAEYGAVYDYAEVTSARPIVKHVTVKTPVRECWEETQYYTVDRRRSSHAGGTILGALIGGVIGHQVGSGRGNDAATVAGTLIGAAIGNESGRQRQGDDGSIERHARPVERCKTNYREHREERIEGYRVTYRYHGQKYVTEMPFDPGQKLRIRVDVRPAE